MDPPRLTIDLNLYEHIRKTDNLARNYMMCDLKMLGEGAAGTTYTAYVKPRDKFPAPVVLKEQGRTKYCVNEFEALKLLREEMMAGKIPGYFIFMYGSFPSGDKKYMILEKADHRVDDYLTGYNINTKTILQIFYHIAQAVSYLEAIQFNHGDLWSENVLMNWKRDHLHLPIPQRDFTIKIIDFDSAFKANTQIVNPSYGGAEKFRKHFYVGYDLNRYFDSLIYSYESYIEKKHDHKVKKIEKLKRQKKKGKKVHIPAMDEPDTTDEEFDAANVMYPQEIIDFFYQLGPQDPNVFKDCPDMSGKAIMKMIADYAAKLKLDLSTMDANKLENDEKSGKLPESDSDSDSESQD